MAIGAALHSLWPIAVGQHPIVAVVGWTLVAASLVLVAAAAFGLRRAGTAFDARKTTTALVTGGAFGVSRNPVYLSMMMLCLGVALIANSLMLLLTALPAGSLLCRLVIRPEERYLLAKFGAAYSDYTRTVRRWL